MASALLKEYREIPPWLHTEPLRTPWIAGSSEARSPAERGSMNERDGSVKAVTASRRTSITLFLSALAGIGCPRPRHALRVDGAVKERPLSRTIRGHALPAPVQAVLVAEKPLDSHGASRVGLLGADADLGPETEAETVREARRGIPDHARRVHAEEEVLGGPVVLRDDGVRVMRAVLVDVVHGLLHGADGPHGEDEVEELGPVILGRGRLRAGHESPGLVVHAELHPGLLETSRQGRKDPRQGLAVDEEGLRRVAHRRVLRLCVEDDGEGLRGVGGPVHVDAADPIGVA